MRLLFKLAFLLTFVFAALVGLIRAQPYDDSELRAFLTPPNGCPLPCQLGIEMEATSVIQATNLLERSGWAEFVGRAYAPDRYAQVLMTTVDWRWTGEQPAWLARGAQSFINWQSDGSDAIRNFRTGTTLTIGDTWLALGRPESGDVLPQYNISNVCEYSLYTAYYLGKQVEILAFVPHPVSSWSYWSAPVEIEFNPAWDAPQDGLHPIYDTHCMMMWP